MAPRWHCDGTEKKICRLFAVFWDLAAVSLRDLKDLKDPGLPLRGPSRLSRPACLGGVRPPNPPCPCRGLRLRREREGTPTAREKLFPLFVQFLAPNAPFATLRDVPPPRFAPKGASRASAVRYRSPTPAQVSTFYAGKDKGGRKRDAEGRLSEPLGERRGSRSLEAKGRLFLKPVPVSFLAGPWGPRTGDCRERSEFLAFFPGCGAQPCRLARAKRRGRRSPLFPKSVTCKE